MRIAIGILAFAGMFFGLMERDAIILMFAGFILVSACSGK